MKGIRQILIAEDNLADLELIKTGFKEINLLADITIVKDGQELLNFFKSSNIDNLGLVLLDLNLPKVDGMEILEQFYTDQVLKNIPIIVFTSSEDNEKIIRAYELGANACIRKPENVNQFSQIIKAISNFWLEINVLPNFKAAAI